MDYQELIQRLRRVNCLYASGELEHPSLARESAAAIETLLAERDAAQKQAQDLKAQLDMYGGEYGITAAFQKAAERDAAISLLRTPSWCNGCANFKGLKGCGIGIMEKCNVDNDHYQFCGPSKGEAK